MTVKEYYFSLNVSPAECELFYTGQVFHVTAIAHNGLSVRLPVFNLKPFITQLGIRGVFRMIVNEENKIQSFEQIK